MIFDGRKSDQKQGNRTGSVAAPATAGLARFVQNTFFREFLKRNPENHRFWADEHQSCSWLGLITQKTFQKTEPFWKPSGSQNFKIS